MRGGIFVIEKKIHGRKFHVSTRCTTLRAALKQLERFEADPGGYDPAGTPPAPDALVLNEKLIDEFHAWHRERVSRPWALDVKNLLIDWANHLKGADLRRLSIVQHIEPHLNGATQRHHRVAALRALTKWARKTERLKRAEDVTLDVEVPKVDAAETAKDMEFERVAEVFPFLDSYMQDIVQVLAFTGWHVNELRRFAANGVVRDREAHEAPEVVGVIGVVHKNALLKKQKNRKHFTALVHAEPYEAAKRIRALGHLYDRGALRKRMVKAAALLTDERRKADPNAAKVKHVHLGAFRHSVSTWLAQSGLSFGEIARYVGHSDEKMAKRHYVNAGKAALALPRAALRVVR